MKTMPERVVGFHGGHCTVDGGVPFSVSFEAIEAFFNGTKIDLSYKGRIEVERTQPADDYFVEAKLKHETPVHLFFKCCIGIKRVSPNSIQVVIDNGEPFAVGINPIAIEQEDQSFDFTETDTYSYRRSSGEDPSYVRLVPKKRRLRIWFSRSLSMGILPIVHDPFFASLDLKMPSVATDDRIKAYQYQKMGLTVKKPGFKEEWEPVQLNDDELAHIEEQRKLNRQREWEEACVEADKRKSA